MKMTKAEHLNALCEDLITRSAMQVLITPDEDGVTVRFNDDHLGNPDLRFPQVHMSHEDFFKAIPHNENTQATFDNALARGETYGIFVDPRVVARLAQWGTPNTQAKYQHTHNKRHQTTDDFNRNGMMSGRV